jgi:hypothetical protein
MAAIFKSFQAEELSGGRNDRTVDLNAMNNPARSE